MTERTREALFVAFIVGVVALAALIVWLNVRRDDAEPVWDGEPLPLAMIPIVVKPDAPLVASTESAARTWEREVGCRLFTVDANAAAPVVTVGEWVGDVCGRDAADEGKRLGSDGTLATWSCGGGRFDVRARNVIEPHRLHVGIAHELGHVLGLSHQSRGLMSSPTDPDVFPVSPSPSALQALRARYCR